MTFVKVRDKIVIYKSPHNDEEGLIEVPDNIYCGMIQNDDGSFSNPPISNEHKFDEIRLKRNRLLFETDSYALSDRNLSDEMKKYRQ